MAKATILLVPGAWHSPAHYDKLRPVLEKHGYETDAVALATVDPKDPANTDLDSDVKVIKSAIENILAKGKDVVLVLHSYSGLPGQLAAYSFIDQHEQKPRLRAVAMIASFLFPPHTPLLGPVGGEPLPIHEVSADELLVTVGDRGPEYYFYNDVSPEEAAKAVSLLKPHSWRCKKFPSAVDGVGWWGIPTWYLLCENDNAIPLEMQKNMVAEANKMLKERGSELTVKTQGIKSSHSPFLSMPEQTAGFLRLVAGEEDVPSK